MATVNLYLKGAIGKKRIDELKKDDKQQYEKELKKERQIYLKLSVFGERLQVYTKKRIAQYYWNSGKQEIDCKKYKNGGVELNQWLFEFKNKVFKIANQKELIGERINTLEIKEILENKTLNKPTSSNFEGYYQSFLAKQKTPGGFDLKPNTINKYTGFYNHITEYSTFSGFKLEISRFDERLLINYKDYLTNTLSLSDNTVARYIRTAKTFIKHYIEQGLIQPYDVSKIKTIGREGEVFVLPIKQVIQLQNHTFESDKLNRVRDLFCFMCWTGQRFSDIKNIKREDLIEDEDGELFWKLVTEKTEEKISVPITHYAQKILDRYSKELTPIPYMSNQKLNAYLKDLGEEIEFDSKVKIVRYYNGKKKEKVVPFYKVLTTHVARKSYITNSLILGVPERVVREVSGHKDEKSFRRYVNLAESYKNNAIKSAYSLENLEKYM